MSDELTDLITWGPDRKTDYYLEEVFHAIITEKSNLGSTPFPPLWEKKINIKDSDTDKVMEKYHKVKFFRNFITRVTNNCWRSILRLIEIIDEKEERDLFLPIQKVKFLQQCKSEIQPRYYMLFNELAALNEFLRKKLDKKIDIEKFEEFNYVRLLRNNFIRHLEPDSPIETRFHGNYGGVSLKEGYLPAPRFIPYSDRRGQEIIFNYYESKIEDEEYLKLDDQEKKDKNKKDFISNSDWVADSSDDFNGLENRIRTFGLPEINQKKLSKELKEIYFDYIFPKYKKETEEINEIYSELEYNGSSPKPGDTISLS